MSKIFGCVAVVAVLVGWFAVQYSAVLLAQSVTQQNKALYQPFAMPGTLASPATTQEHQDENR